MKTEQILIRLSEEEMKELNTAFKKAMMEDEKVILTRSEFVRRLLKIGLKSK